MRKYFLGVMTTLMLGVVIAFWLSLSGRIPIAATSKEPASLAWFLHTTYENAVRRNAADITVPSDLNSDQLVLKGAKNFAAMCAGCHTAPGKQATAASLGLNPPPPKAVVLAAELTAAERFWVISNGVKMTGMPAFAPAHKDEDDLWALVAFTGKLPNLDARSYEEMVAKARAQMPGEDGHNHSHMGAESAQKDQTLSDHGSVSMKSLSKPGRHESAGINKHDHGADDVGSDPNEPAEADMKAAAEPPKSAEQDHSGHAH